MSNSEYQIPQEIIDSILADCGLESIHDGRIQELDDHVSEK